MGLVWSTAAQRDLLSILDYYAEIDPSLAVEMMDRISAVPEILLEHPRIGSPIVGSRDRKWRAHKTPFLLIYRVHKGTVQISRVLHSAANWRKA